MIELVFFAVITRAFGGRFECNISGASDAAQHNVNVFRFHDITALSDRGDWFRNFKSAGIWCRWDCIWFAIATAGVRIYWKLYTIWNFNCSAMTCGIYTNWMTTATTTKSIAKHFLRVFFFTIHIPTLWHPGFCQAISFEITSVAQMAMTITTWMHAILYANRIVRSKLVTVRSTLVSKQSGGAQ